MSLRLMSAFHIDDIPIVMHILLIEDDPSSVTLTRRMLQQIAPEIHFTVAASGEEAEQLLRKWEEGENHHDFNSFHPPDVVILDMGLPGIHGLEVLSLLRASPITGKLPVMVFTVSQSEQDRERAFASGATMYVTKPKDAVGYRQRITTIYESALIYQIIYEQFEFTTREAAVVLSLCRGYSTDDASKQLFIAPATLRAHLRNIFRKAEVTSRMELVSKALFLLIHKIADVQAQLEQVQRQFHEEEAALQKAVGAPEVPGLISP